MVWATLAADGDHTLDTGGHIQAVTGNTDTGTRHADDDDIYLLTDIFCSLKLCINYSTYKRQCVCVFHQIGE